MRVTDSVHEIGGVLQQADTRFGEMLESHVSKARVPGPELTIGGPQL
ncbi:hypothetical protein [Bradyrhizobium sp. dw_411]|nr:hypothetical protein [Bradyrhizobium sp. dw_411]